MEKEKNEIKLKNRETKYDNGLGKVHEIIVDLGDKEVKKEVFERGNSVSALVYNTVTKKFIFVQQYRIGAESLILEIPAGTLEPGENPMDCIKREITEEIGYKCDKITHIQDFYTSPGFCTEIMSVYYVEVSEKISEGGGISNEKIEIVEVDELGLNGNVFFNLPENGEFIPPYKVIDSKSIIAINWYVTKEMLTNLWSKISDYKMKSL
jgi:ADP-ribose pyrophosphatase